MTGKFHPLPLPPPNFLYGSSTCRLTPCTFTESHFWASLQTVIQTLQEDQSLSHKPPCKHTVSVPLPKNTPPSVPKSIRRDTHACVCIRPASTSSDLRCPSCNHFAYRGNLGVVNFQGHTVDPLQSRNPVSTLDLNVASPAVLDLRMSFSPLVAYSTSLGPAVENRIFCI